MRRREFLRVASGAAGATAAGASSATAQETTTAPGTNETDGGGGNQTGGAGGNQTGENGAGAGGDGGGGSTTVSLVDFAFEPGTEEPLYVTPGTTVTFVWETATHNIVVDDQPGEADWAGHEAIEDSGFEYEHTFEVEGEYEYHCQPHINQGMEGVIVVNQEGAPPGGEAPAEVDPEHMGVPFQAHFVGLATIVAIFVSLVFTFFFLKYGETPHSGYPEEK